MLIYNLSKKGTDRKLCELLIQEVISANEH